MGETAVIGLGRSGVAATRLLRSRGEAVYASDAGTGDAVRRAGEDLAALGATVDTGKHDLGRIARASELILSPGVPPDAPPVRAARDAGVPIRAEIDLGLEALADTPYIGVTGTNGKSTVTALVGHLLRAAGRHALAVGNIGTPLTSVALQSPRPEWLAIEFSSFQLHDTARVNPRAGILTNLAPDHLDRYPTLEEYYEDKRRLFMNARPESVWVSNADDPDSVAMVAGIPGHHLRFSSRAKADGWYDRDRDRLMLGSSPLLDRRDLRLLGDHNVENALAAALAVQSTGVSTPSIAEGLRTFTALTHRLEPVGEIDGVLWINDSKATNVASTEKAVAAVDRPFVLLLGGRHKGEPYTRLIPLLQGRCRAVVAYGEARPIVVQDLAQSVKVVEAANFEDVLHTARSLAQRGDAVLLSPACSSYDMFNNYEERGATFRQWVETMRR
ncbi:MAG TPA: UDP-N-acetylmuramoyl-L-alanine--D-glutamate ligase [Gemmatimonadales bacterium]|nr:UDP-N-acetylmuramoyl-L-alanine--D-glutamate ligase [Gemmatimonadales bacterium]